MHDVTRRSFIRLVTGSLVSLPTLAGGLIVAPSAALADVDGQPTLTGGESEPVVIDVVMPWEVGFMVVDVTKGTENEAGMVSYPPVPGATVTVTSRYNGKVARGTTDSDGIANLDIKDLSVESGATDDDTQVAEYYFNGSVSVVTDGYRTFQTGLMLIEGGSGLQVPAHPADASDMPYPHLTTFDDWDGLYSANEFAVTPKNEETHDIQVVVGNIQAGEKVGLELWVDGEETSRATSEATVESDYQLGMKGSKAVTGTVARASFSGNFLKEGDAAALPVGASVAVTMTYQEKTYTWPLALNVSDSVSDQPVERTKVKLSPINVTAGSALDLKWPTDAPLMGGGFLKFWVPELPINIYVNPFGYAQLTLKSPSWGYLNDWGASDKNGWGKYPRKTVAQQWDKKVKTLSTMADKTTSLVSKPGFFQQLDLFRSFSVMVNFQLLALAKWDKKAGLFQGEVAGQILAAMNFTVTENFFMGPLPVLITFSIDASLIFSLAASCYSPKKNKDEDILDAIGDFSRWKWDYTNGLALTLNVTPSLSVGIGLRGAVSISVKGSVTFTLYLGVPFTNTPAGGSPHYMAGWSAMVSLVLEFFFFTKSFALFNQKYTPWYDSWSDGDYVTQGAETSLKSALGAKNLSDVTGELNIITDEMMAETCEFASTALTAQAEPQDPVSVIDDLVRAFDEMEAKAETRVVEADDGRPVTYTVMSFGPSSKTDLTDEPNADDSLVVAGDEAGEETYDSETGVGYVRLTAQSDEVPTLPEAGVASLGSFGGLRPSSDVPLVADENGNPLDVFGDPHVKVQNIKYIYTQNGKYIVRETRAMFRLATVDIGGGQIRTRVVISRLSGDTFRNGSSSLVIEWIDDPGDSQYVNHTPLFDYDFDVACGYKNELFKSVLRPQATYAQGLNEFSIIELVTLSGVRAEGNDTTLARAATDLIFTAMNIPVYTLYGYDGDGNQIKADPGVLRPRNTWGQVSMPAQRAIGTRPDDFHSITNVRLITISSLRSDPACYICYLDRIGATADQTVSDQAEPNLGILIIDWFGREIVRPDLSDFDIGQFDSSVYELVAYPSTESGHTLMLRGATKASYVLVDFNTRQNTVTSMVRCEDYDPNVRLVFWPYNFTYPFLASFPNDESALGDSPDEHDYAKWTLHGLKWSDDPTPRLVGEAVGPTGFNVGNFAVNAAGTFLFWPQSREPDEDRVYDSEGSEDVCDRPATYHVMASRIRGDHFSDPFIVAELPNDTDALADVSVYSPTEDDMDKDKALVAVRTELVSKHDDSEGLPIYSAAHLWYTEVPAVRSATAVACEAPVPFVCPGGSIDFHVAIRNDGNVFLSGCTLTMYLLDEATGSYASVKGASAKVTFDATSLLESTYNKRGDDGTLDDIEPDHALCPGKTSVYAVTVTVPKDWKEGAKKVLFVASDGQVAPDTPQPASMTTAAESDPSLEAAERNARALEFHIEPGEYDVVPVRTSPSAEKDADQRHMETIHVTQVAATGDFMPSPVKESDTDGKPVIVPVRRITPSDGNDSFWGDTHLGAYGGMPYGGEPGVGRRNAFGGAAGSGSSASGRSTGSGSSASGRSTGSGSSASGGTMSVVPTPWGSGQPAWGETAGTGTNTTTAAPSATTPSQVVAGTGTGAGVASGGAPGTLALTGDDGGTGALAAGMAALGAAVLAYERRRAQNEEDR